MPLAVAAERDVEVVAQPGRQRDVPAPPELGDARRPGRASRSSAGTRSRASAPRPIAMSRVAGEVAVDLEGVRRPRRARRSSPCSGRGCEDGSATRGAGVGEQHLLDQPDDEEEQPAARARRQCACGRRSCSRDVAVAHDRAGDQLREERDEGREVDSERAGADLARGRRRSCSSSTGTCRTRCPPAAAPAGAAPRASPVAQVAGEEVGVLEVERGAPGSPAARRTATSAGAGRRGGARDAATGDVVDRDRDDQHRQEDRLEAQ